MRVVGVDVYTRLAMRCKRKMLLFLSSTQGPVGNEIPTPLPQPPQLQCHTPPMN